MTDVATVLLAFALGAILGIVFFGGLWWTVARGTASRHAAAWFLFSLLLRTGAVMLGFYLIGHGSWEKLAACVAGFALARLIVMRFTADAALPPPSAGTASHAP
jgi:F1F0 ATPase subunit 2